MGVGRKTRSDGSLSDENSERVSCSECVESERKSGPANRAFEVVERLAKVVWVGGRMVVEEGRAEEDEGRLEPIFEAAGWEADP